MKATTDPLQNMARLAVGEAFQIPRLRVQYPKQTIAVLTIWKHGNKKPSKMNMSIRNEKSSSISCRTLLLDTTLQYAHRMLNRADV